MNKKSIYIMAVILAVFTTSTLNAQKAKKNILFIAIDDMKPILGAYGDDFAISPNIDKLAEHGTTFYNNHCQFAVCGPSRASFLSGQRPDQTQIIDLKTKIRSKRPDVVTLPQYFKNNGYLTMGVGKIFDPRSVDKKQDEKSWDEYILPGQLKYPKENGSPALSYYQDPKTKAKIQKLREEAISKGITDGNKQYHYITKRCKPAYENADVPDAAYMDYAFATEGINLMKRAVKGGKPFFLAVGFKRPHLPFVAPKKYWDMYDESKVPLALFQQKVKGGVDIAYHNSPELRSYQIPGYTYELIDGVVEIPEVQQRKLIHGYYAATTYIDVQVGRLLEALKKEGLDKNTIIILWGDHGWHLGDHKLWNKHSNFEQATRSPMIIFDPEINKKIIVNSPTEFVDVYPTLCDLAGIDVPDDLAGVTLQSLLNGSKTKVKEYAFSEMTRGNPEGEIIGYSLRNDRYRYTAWVGDDPIHTQKLSENKIIGEELYDYNKDPLEKKSYINDPKYKEILDGMRKDFKYFFDNERTFKGDVQ